VDFGVSGQRGDQLARAIARKYGIPEANLGTYNRHIINVDGQRYSLQLLWKVEGHYNHVHFGIRRARPSTPWHGLSVAQGPLDWGSAPRSISG
jgi:hypothetical protein